MHSVIFLEIYLVEHKVQVVVILIEDLTSNIVWTCLLRIVSEVEKNNEFLHLQACDSCKGTGAKAGE